MKVKIEAVGKILLECPVDCDRRARGLTSPCCRGGLRNGPVEPAFAGGTCLPLCDGRRPGSWSSVSPSACPGSRSWRLGREAAGSQSWVRLWGGLFPAKTVSATLGAGPGREARHSPSCATRRIHRHTPKTSPVSPAGPAPSTQCGAAAFPAPDSARRAGPGRCVTCGVCPFSLRPRRSRDE